MKQLKTEDYFNTLFNLLVPPSGNTGTLQGEVIRAINKVAYRYYNDGDKFYEGYGCETAGPAIAFLLECKELKNVKTVDGLTVTTPTNIYELVTNVEGALNSEYESFLNDLMEEGINFIVDTQDEDEWKWNWEDLSKTSKPPRLITSEEDYLEYESHWIDEEEEEDPWDYYDDDEEEYIW